jgi:hypothetical protein
MKYTSLSEIKSKPADSVCSRVSFRERISSADENRNPSVAQRHSTPIKRWPLPARRGEKTKSSGDRKKTFQVSVAEGWEVRYHRFEGHVSSIFRVENYRTYHISITHKMENINHIILQFMWKN